jgi:hypothetical protein
VKHSHYKKSVEGLRFVDVYRVLQLFGVTDQALGHAIKKLLVAGGRGVKDIGRDVREAIDTLERWQEMQRETLPDVAVRNVPAPSHPAWPDDKAYRWMVQSKDGTWYSTREKPFLDGDCWMGGGLPPLTLRNDAPDPNWRDALIERGADE